VSLTVLGTLPTPATLVARAERHAGTHALPHARAFASRDRGSAIPEFVMVAALLLFVAMGVFQLGLALYVRNTLISAASEGARYGARADASPGDGVARTEALITSSLNGSFAVDVQGARTVTDSGVRVVEVRVTAPLPVIGPVGPSGMLTVSGRAFSEEQVTTGVSP
jgi:Flp pilus assembly protein TadG